MNPPVWIVDELWDGRMKPAYLTVIETGDVTEESLEPLIEWMKEGSSDGDILGAVHAENNDTIVEKYWKGHTPDGRRFLYMGTDESFRRWQRGQLQ